MARVIAFYLPQFHPILENDKWWGKGFTEWTNVAKARSLFRGHYQPRIPADLGFYDLRLSDVREAQAQMAYEAGVEGFCYWHYWFGNEKRLLERPFDEVLNSGKPDFPFCFGWANHSWYNKTWDLKGKDTLLIEQKYLGTEDYTKHFYDVLLPAFKDHRYILVDGKPLFVIFQPLDSPEIEVIISTWRKLAIDNGLGGIYFVGKCSGENKSEVLKIGFDAVYRQQILNIHIRQSVLKKMLLFAKVKIFNCPRIYSYKEAIKYMYDEEDLKEDTIPTIVPNFDHTPRSGVRGYVFVDSSPELFFSQVKKAYSLVKDKPKDHQFLFLQSWNEWGEGNYMEPDLKFKDGYLKALKSALKEC